MKIYDGTSQIKRNNHLHDDDYFHVMELNFHDLICFIKDYSKDIRFFNLKNEADGNWDEMLVADEIIIISEILTYDIQLIENEFENVIEKNHHLSNQNILSIVEPIVKIVEQIDFWYVSIKKSNSDGRGSLENELKGLIQNVLSRDLHQCNNLIQTLYSEEIAIKELDYIWLAGGNDAVPDKFTNDIVTYFKKVFNSFKNSISFLKQKSKYYLEQSMKSQQHAPNMALLITFLRLYLQSINKFNDFTNRYFDFYYDEILKIKPKTYSPDKTYLQFELKEGVTNCLIKKDTLFLAGKDNSKKKIYYSTDKDLVINTANVAKLYTLYCEQNKLIWPQSKCTAILIDEIPVSNLVTEQYGIKSRDLFGGSKKISFENANIGFVISDGCLLLNQGRRKVSLEFRFTDKSYLVFTKHLYQLFGKEKLSDAFIKLFSNIFVVYVSVENDWLKIKDYVIDGYLIDLDRKKNTLSLEFKLSVNDPAIVSINQKVHGKYLIEDVPAIKILLNSDSYLYPYDLLKKLEIDQIVINTDVEEFKDVTVSNDLGLVDITKPFHPFGVTPQVNSYFILGAVEFSKKKLTSLSVKIKWNNLPSQHDGLAGYFDAYKVKLKNSNYKCAITFLNNGEWLPKEENLKDKQSLFISDFGEQLQKISFFKKIDTSLYQQNLKAIANSVYQYDNCSSGGFVKFTFFSPSFAFGHSNYPDILSEISINNAKKKIKKPLPNPPFSPSIESIQIDYKAHSTIDFSSLNGGGENLDKQFYHIYPWGYEEILGKTKFDHIHFIPSFDDKGNLFIGLENAEANWTVSLLFNLLEDSKLEVAMEPPVLKWEYLASNQWRTLSNTAIVSDSTAGFLNSGIVKITLPEDIDKNNTILSDSLHWIKVSATKNLESICSVLHISAQAVQLKWINQNNDLSHLDTVLPASTISKAKEILPGIKNINQPLSSFNGEVPEDKVKVKLRISERLRHKNRAVTSWDYERIILQLFPNLYKVKCISHSTSNSSEKPGYLLIVVIGNIESSKEGVFYDPMLGNKILHDIKELLTGLNSGFANIEVRNPVYERIQIRCAVKIKSGLDSGYFIDLLNTKLIEYLSPWQSNSLNEAGFGNVIKCTDVLSFIQNLDFIEWATDFSILHVSYDSKEKYYLLDTAEKRKNKPTTDIETYDEVFKQNRVSPTYPWAILLPMQEHAIEVIYDNKEIRANRTGIDKLLLESTFIIED